MKKVHFLFGWGKYIHKICQMKLFLFLRCKDKNIITDDPSLFSRNKIGPRNHAFFYLYLF